MDALSKSSDAELLALPPTTIAAIEELSKLLYWKMEHLDPGDDPEFVEWERLNSLAVNSV